jgi:hypothetical protein
VQLLHGYFNVSVDDDLDINIERWACHCIN